MPLLLQVLIRWAWLRVLRLCRLPYVLCTELLLQLALKVLLLRGRWLLLLLQILNARLKVLLRMVLPGPLQLLLLVHALQILLILLQLSLLKDLQVLILMLAALFLGGSLLPLLVELCAIPPFLRLPPLLLLLYTEDLLGRVALLVRVLHLQRAWRRRGLRLGLVLFALLEIERGARMVGLLGRHLRLVHMVDATVHPALRMLLCLQLPLLLLVRPEALVPLVAVHRPVLLLGNGGAPIRRAASLEIRVARVGVSRERVEPRALPRVATLHPFYLASFPQLGGAKRRGWHTCTLSLTR